MCPLTNSNQFSNCFPGSSSTDQLAVHTLAFLQRIVTPGQVTEVFIKDARNVGEHLTGFFDFEHLDQLVECTVGQFVSPAAVYFRVNPVRAESLSRASNQLCPTLHAAASKTRDILGRRLILLDVDPVRKHHESATDAEHNAALQRLADVTSHLEHFGWQALAIIDTGNGGCAYYRIDLPTDDEGLVKATSAKLSEEFGDAQVKIDRAVHDATRLGRLPGTMNCKGTSTWDRPHRPCQIITLNGCSEIVVSRQMIEEFVGKRPKTANDVLEWTEASDEQLEQARRYVNKIPGAIAGQGGHNRTFEVACRLVIGFAIPADQALPLLREYNDRCVPPWTEPELRRKLTDAKRTLDEDSSGFGNLIHSKLSANVVREAERQIPSPEFIGFIPDFGTAAFKDVIRQFESVAHNIVTAFERLLHFTQWTKFNSGIVVPDVLLRQIY